MATTLAMPQRAARPTDITTSDRILAGLASLLLLAVLIAIARGYGDYAGVPRNVWLHIATIFVALVLTPVMLLRPRGDRLHRRLGYVWVSAMALTAIISFDIRLIMDGHFSFIHILSVWTLIQLPLIVWTARSHRVPNHRRAVRGMVIGALLLAGVFHISLPSPDGQLAVRLIPNRRRPGAQRSS